MLSLYSGSPFPKLILKSIILYTLQIYLMKYDKEIQSDSAYLYFLLLIFSFFGWKVYLFTAFGYTIPITVKIWITNQMIKTISLWRGMVWMQFQKFWCMSKWAHNIIFGMTEECKSASETLRKKLCCHSFSKKCVTITAHLV